LPHADAQTAPQRKPASESYLTTPNLFVESDGRRIAYRSVGSGKPIVMCTRFRATMDDWDPAFIDALAAQGLRVITFDYSGLGLSTGKPTYHPNSLGKDANDLIVALDLKDVIIGGWSMGGMGAQVVVASYPARISHCVLMGTLPPGPHVKMAEQLFYDTAPIPEYSFEHQVILFFEPKSAVSRAAARRSKDRIAQRTQPRSVPVPAAWAATQLGDKPARTPWPDAAVLEALKNTPIPILHIGGDHDLPCPVENWYALSQQLPTLNIVTYPSAGHGPQHERPVFTAELIAGFARSTSRPGA